MKARTKLHKSEFNSVCSSILKVPSVLCLQDVEITISSVLIAGRNRNWITTEHQHPNYELATCLEGGCTTYCENDTVVCTSDYDVVFCVTPLTLHHRTFLRKVNTKVFCFVFTCLPRTERGIRICEKLPLLISGNHYQFRMNEQQKELLQQLITVTHSKSPLKLTLGKQLIHTLLIRFFYR